MGKVKISSQLIANAARARGWDVQYFDDSFSSLVKITPPGKEPEIFRSTVTTKDSYVGGSITNNKYETYLLLKDMGLPVPNSALYSKDLAEAFLNAHERIVVKPASTDHGDGITIDVQSTDQLEAAITYAEQYSKKDSDTLLQEQLPGGDHRMLVVGDSVFVARRQEPVVVGDGVHTIRELVRLKNEDPRRGDAHSGVLSKIDEDRVAQYLGTNLDRIPVSGEAIKILGVSNLSAGGESVELTAVAHESFKDVARRAARALRLRVCAVDIMCTDITQPIESQQAGIIEMNILPGIRMHHFPSEGEPVDAAGAILDEVFGESV